MNHYTSIVAASTIFVRSPSLSPALRSPSDFINTIYSYVKSCSDVSNCCFRYTYHEARNDDGSAARMEAAKRDLGAAHTFLIELIKSNDMYKKRNVLISFQFNNKNVENSFIHYSILCALPSHTHRQYLSERRTFQN